MSFITRFVNWAVGNGYDLSEDEDIIQRHKNGTKECLEVSRSHFTKMRRKLSEVTSDPDAEREKKSASDTHSCFGM